MHRLRKRRRADGSQSTGDRFNRTGMRSEFTRLFINLGSVDGFSRGDLLGYICNHFQDQRPYGGQDRCEGCLLFL